MKRRGPFWLFVVVLLMLGLSAAIGQKPDTPRRRATPINSEATRTQPRNDAEGDSARALERRRARSLVYDDGNGKVIMLDTVTGQEWVDSTLLPKAPPMKYPLLHTINAGINVFDLAMRAFGQQYGGADAFVNVGLHNRYFPTFEFGMGSADHTPKTGNYTYETPLSPYFKIGCDYNFFYNSDPAYKIFAMARYGFSPFRYSLSNITLNDPYWQETASFGIPAQNVTAGWFELGIGIQVKLFGNVSAGWAIKYHSILHQSHPSAGDAWYIPGYGSAGSSLGVSFSVVYTIPFPDRSASKIKDASPSGRSFLEAPVPAAAPADSVQSDSIPEPFSAEDIDVPAPQNITEIWK